MSRRDRASIRAMTAPKKRKRGRPPAGLRPAAQGFRITVGLTFRGSPLRLSTSCSSGVRAMKHLNPQWRIVVAALQYYERDHQANAEVEVNTVLHDAPYLPALRKQG